MAGRCRGPIPQFPYPFLPRPVSSFTGVTSPSRLGIQGGSNGGMLVANAMVRQPSLFGAVVCEVPLLDMRRRAVTELHPPPAIQPRRSESSSPPDHHIPSWTDVQSHLSATPIWLGRWRAPPLGAVTNQYGLSLPPRPPLHSAHSLLAQVQQALGWCELDGRVRQPGPTAGAPPPPPVSLLTPRRIPLVPTNVPLPHLLLLHAHKRPQSVAHDFRCWDSHSMLTPCHPPFRSGST